MVRLLSTIHTALKEFIALRLTFIALFLDICDYLGNMEKNVTCKFDLSIYRALVKHDGQLSYRF